MHNTKICKAYLYLTILCQVKRVTSTAFFIYNITIRTIFIHRERKICSRHAKGGSRKAQKKSHIASK